MRALPVSETLAKGLDEDQLRAVGSFHDSCLIVAGAGSGKTRVLIHGLAHLVQDHHLPISQIALLTFTRQAAAEMKQRAQALVGEQIQDLMCGTFHSVALEILQGQDIPALANETELNIILSRVLRSSDMADELPSLHELPALFSLAGEVGLPRAAKFFHQGKFHDYLSGLQQLYQEYQKAKAEAAVMDYADLLQLFLHWLDTPKGKSMRLHRNVVLVDETQDLSDLQRAIVAKMTEFGHAVQVGDPAQTIYGFRLVDDQALQELATTMKVCRLPNNYRCSGNIVQAAKTLMNSGALTVDVQATNDAGAKPALVVVPTVEYHVQAIVQWLSQLLEQGINPNQAAILGRTHQHLHVASLALQQMGIAATYLGASEQSRQLHHLQLLMLSLARLAQDPRCLFAYEHLLEIFDVDWETREAWLAGVKAKKYTLQHLADFIGQDSEQFEALLQLLDQHDPDLMLWTKLLALIDATPQQKTALLALGQKASQTSDFISYVVDVQAQLEATTDAVNVGTVHGAKGLEWDHVLIVNGTVGAFPMLGDDYEQERRLMYVAMTRAKHTLTIVRCQWLRKRFVSRSGLDFFDGRVNQCFDSTEIQLPSEDDEFQDYVVELDEFQS